MAVIDHPQGRIALHCSELVGEALAETGSGSTSVLALAAQQTRNMKIGTGVNVPGLRLAPVTANGIATIVIGSARDIVEECGVARFLFSDFPLGNPCGRPYDEDMQHRIVGFALDLIESATLPRTTVQTPFVWDEDASWKDRYARVDAEKAAVLKAAGDARRARQSQAKDDGRARSG